MIAVWSFLCPPPSSTSPSCRRIVVACNSGVRDGGENSGNVASPHRNAVIHPACISSLSSVPRHASFLSLSLPCARNFPLIHRSLTALTPMCVRCSNVVPCARYVHLLLLPVYTQHTRTHARTRSAECYR